METSRAHTLYIRMGVIIVSLSRLTDHRRFQVEKYGSRYVFSSASFAEESIERVTLIAKCSVAGHLTVGLNAMLQAVQLPARISHLNASLTNVE